MLPALRWPKVTIRNTGSQGAANPYSTTGYSVGPWSYTNSIKRSDGFANRLYDKGDMDMDVEILMSKYSFRPEDGPSRVCRSKPGACKVSSSSYAFTGTVNVKVAPLPFLLFSAHILPP